AVAHERPNLTPSRSLQSAILEILDEARMVDRLDRPEAHRDRRKFPKVRHQPRMRIRRQPAAGLQLTAKILQLLPRDPTFQISARVNPRRRVSLKVNNVAVSGFSRRL